MKQETPASLELAYLSPEALAPYCERYKDHVLGIVGFGRTNTAADKIDSPVVWVDMPVLSGASMFEVWTHSAPVSRADNADIRCSRTDEILYGCFEIDQLTGENMESLTFRAYSKLFDFIDRESYSNLLRIWHYFPHINASENGQERYHGFNAGRHEAFTAKARIIGKESVPAACALGSRSGPMVIYFLASKTPGMPLENPRQTSAYHYPAQYGPRSPTFSRAMLVGAGRQQKLFISGTASILGHETRHQGDASAQARETVENIRALLEEARRAGFEPSDAERQWALKIYLNDSTYLSLVRAQVIAEFGAALQVIYLQADVCRADLLLEIEAVCSYGNQSDNPS